MKKTTSGFTIVELLIVIVVIAILAAISIVAYNGIQSRARYSAMQSDVASLNKAIQLYYTEKGSYPFTYVGAGANFVSTAGSTQTLNIPGLVPDFIAKIPQIPNDGVGGYYAYISSPNGVDYKIVRLVGGGTPPPLPDIEKSDSRSDPVRPGRGWGYWSPGGQNTL